MATRDKAKLYASDAANREKKVYAIYQSNNHQWLYAPAASKETEAAIKRKKEVYFFYPQVSN